jgi:aminopeptidase N
VATAAANVPNAEQSALVSALRSTLRHTGLDPAFREVALSLPSETMLSEEMDVIHPHAIRRARQTLRRVLAEQLREEFLEAYHANQTPGPYSPDPQSVGKRALKNLALSYLRELDDDAAHALMQKQYDHAGNMTDRLAALTDLVNSSAPGRQERLDHFYDEFRHEALVIDKWFTLQATARGTDVAAARELARHPAFTLKNPNRVRSLVLAFCNANPAQFHAADGSGYAFWAEHVIALDAINPQVAARLARVMDRWRKYAQPLREKMREALQCVADTPSLSGDVLEIISKSLAN